MFGRASCVKKKRKKDRKKERTEGEAATAGRGREVGGGRRTDS